MPQPIRMPVAEWSPDSPDLDGSTSVQCQNVLPLTPESYGPLPQPQIFSSALSKRCQGFYGGLDKSGAVHDFAGDANDLYKLVSANNGAWQNASKSPAAYGISANDMWRFVFMKGLVLACNIADPIQKFAIDSDTAFADLSGTPPNAKHMAVISNFLMLGNTNDGTNGQQPQWTWWSAFNDPTNWPTPGGGPAAQVQSGNNPLYGEGGEIQAVIGNLGTADGAVFQEHAVFRVMYVGPPNVFDMRAAEGVKGTPAPYSVVQLGAVVYYYGEDGFYVFDGTSSQPIGALKVDAFMKANLDANYVRRIVGAVDPKNKLIAWAVPLTGNSSGVPNAVLFYNYQINRWAIAYITVETVGRMLSFQYTLDQLYTVFGYTIDSIPYGLDSPAWVGSQLILACFDSAHKMNLFNGNPMAATITTGEIEPIRGRTTLFDNVRPVIAGANPSVALGVRDRQGDSPVFGAAVATNDVGECPQGVSGRYGRAQIIIPAGVAWTHAMGVDLVEYFDHGQ